MGRRDIGPRNRRALTDSVRALFKSGVNPRPWVNDRVAGYSADEATKRLLSRAAEQQGEWSLEQLVRTYFDEQIRMGHVRHGVRDPPSESTARDVKALLRARPFRTIAPLMMRELDEGILERFRDEMSEAHGGSTSRKAISYVSAALSWARKFHPTRSINIRGKAQEPDADDRRHRHGARHSGGPTTGADAIN